MAVDRKRNIWTVDPYVYKATNSGVEIYDLVSSSLINQLYISEGINSVWADNSYVYVATTNSGVYRCSVSTVTETLYFTEYKNFPDITSSEVNYIHGNGDYLCIVTTSGVDRYRISDNYREYNLVGDVTKCYQTTFGDYYYVVNPSFNDSCLDDNIFGWDYGRIVELSSPIPSDNFQLLIEIPITQPDNVYIQATSSGIDIRVINDTGVCIPYRIVRWDYVNPIQIWVKLPKDTDKLYVLYGNVDVTDTSTVQTITYNPSPPSYIVGRGASINDLFYAAELHAVYNSGGGHVYEAKQHGIISSAYINDIYVTENTSLNGGNVLFLATSYGAYIIEEKRDDEDSCNKRLYLISS